MKIIGLLPFRDEAWILPACLSSLSRVVDEIVAIDDGSADGSRAMVEASGAQVVSNDVKSGSGWPEHSIRERLLDLGRQHEGTHFVCLDADEAITHGEQLRQICGSLAPGQKLSLQWLALWRSASEYRADGSVWSDLYKDFVFCDDGRSSHEFASLGVGRTPGPTSPANTTRILPQVSCVLHFQFAAWNRFQMKQAWYRCSELIEAPATANEINRKYGITLDDPKVRLRRIPQDWTRELTIPANLESTPPAWHYPAVLAYFARHGIEFFEPLQIWHVPELRREFLSRAAREPRPYVNSAPTVAYWSYRFRKAVYGRLPAGIQSRLSRPTWRS
jgi:glycosyltransferase involved in cell wall biosynthesis